MKRTSLTRGLSYLLEWIIPCLWWWNGMQLYQRSGQWVVLTWLSLSLAGLASLLRADQPTHFCVWLCGYAGLMAFTACCDTATLLWLSCIIAMMGLSWRYITTDHAKHSIFHLSVYLPLLSLWAMAVLQLVYNEKIHESVCIWVAAQIQCAQWPAHLRQRANGRHELSLRKTSFV